MPTHWFDAHLDLACIAAMGRDMTKPLAQATTPWPPASVTLDSLREGHVTRFLATIFTEAGGNDPGVSYPPGDAAAAHEAGVSQLQTYQSWHRVGLVHIDGTQQWGGDEVSRSQTTAPLRCSLLMECADPIRVPAELSWWVERGVRSIGLAWGNGSRYAAGNTQDPATDPGLTPMGRELVREMDRLHVVHDVSHLSDRALDDLLAATNKPVIASHSNCRSLIARQPLPPGAPKTTLQRHLADDTIREIARRGGVIGLNLYSPFLIPGALRTRRATVDEAMTHVEHICTLAGHTSAVGLGSDMDGGFSGAMLPEGIDRPSDLSRLVDAFSARGWSDEDIERFAWKNWTDFFDTRATG